MGVVPTNDAALGQIISRGDDLLQLRDQTGKFLGWIDGSGFHHGAMSPANTPGLGNYFFDVFQRSGANLGSNFSDYLNSWVPNSGNAHGTTSAENVSAYTGGATAVSPTQSATAVVTALNGGTDNIGVAVRVSGAPHSNVSYYAVCETTTSLFLIKDVSGNDSGVSRTVLASTSVTGSVGDVLSIKIIGNTIFATQNRTTATLQVNDASSPLVSGFSGVYQQGDTATIGSFTFKNANPPAGVTANVVCDGDSITEGAGLFSPWSDYLTFPKGHVPYVTNLGVEGKGLGVGLPAMNAGTIESMLVTGPTVVDPLFVPGAANICVIWGGTNDIASGGRTFTQVYADLTTYVANRHAAGWKIVVVPLLSHVTTDTSCQAFNQLVTANSAGADAIVSFPQALVGTGAYTNLTFFQSGGVHPVQFTATSIIAPAISAAIASLI